MNKRVISLLAAGMCMLAITACGEKPKKSGIMLTPTQAVITKAPEEDKALEGLVYNIDYENNSVAINYYEGNATTLKLPEKIDGIPVTLLAPGAVLGTRVEKIIIPSSMSELSGESFVGASSLKEIEVSTGNSRFVSENGVLFTADSKTLISYPAAKEGTSYEIPETVENVAKYAFYECAKLNTLHIGRSVGSITAESVFNCSLVSEYTVASENLSYEANDGVLFVKGKKALVAFPADKSAVKYVIPAEVVNIFDYAFCGATKVEGVTFPKKLAKIGEYSFAGCTGLSGIELGKLVKEIGVYAFYNCESVKTIVLGASVEAIGMSAFNGCRQVSKLTLPKKLTTIGDFAFANCTKLAKLTVPDSVTYLGEGAFAVDTALASVVVGKNISCLEDGVFFGCEALAKVKLGAGIERIDDSAFEGCKSLEEISLPKKVRILRNKAFKDCEKLSKVTLNSSLETICDYCFENCTALTKLEMPETVKLIEKDAFKNCKVKY